MTLEELNDEKLRGELRDLEGLGLSKSILDPMKESICYAIRAQNGIPDNERIKNLAMSSLHEKVGLMRFMYSMMRGNVPDKGAEKWLYLLKPFGWQIALLGSVALLTHDFDKLILFVQTFTK